MRKEEKFIKMIEILKQFGYKAKITSEVEWGDEFFTFEIVPQKSTWLQERFNIQFDNANGKYKFFVALNIKDKGLNLKDRTSMINFWNNAEEICQALNKLNLSYVVNEELAEYIKKANTKKGKG